MFEWLNRSISGRSRLLLGLIPITVAFLLMIGTLSMLFTGYYLSRQSLILNILLPFMIGLPGFALLSKNKVRQWSIIISIILALLGLLILRF